MKIFAVIDTNVVVSALLTHNPQSPTISLLEKVRDGKMPQECACQWHCRYVYGRN